MTIDARDLRLAAEAARAEADRAVQRAVSAERALTAAEAACSHSWSDPLDISYDEEVGEPDTTRPIFRGVDLVNYETHRVRRRVPRWERICRACGKVERTSSVRAVRSIEPDFA